MNVPDLFRLEGRVALVTGAGRGIGLSIAQALAEAGAAVAIQDIDLDVATAEAQRLVDAGGRAVAIGGDATKLADVESWVPAVERALGPVDVLVNNASIQSGRPLVEWSGTQVEEILRANFATPFRLCQLVVEHMKAQRWGRILNIGSIQGLSAHTPMAPYSASKAALHNLTQALAKDLGPHGVTANAIAPGIVDTLRNSAFFEGHRDHDFKWIPLRRAGKPDDYRAVALLLCSDAGAYMTGCVVSVDGGMNL